MKIFCIGRNYAKHAKEMNSDIPESPLVFMKPETAINRSGNMMYPPFTEDLHYELEVVLYINKNGKNIPVDQAEEYYSEIGLGIDFTARDIQRKCKEKSHPWEKAKSFDDSAYLGEKYGKEKFISDDISFRLQKNGEVVQNANTRDLIFDFNTLISYISGYFTLEPGDIIFTGTPEGVGPVQAGDLLEGILMDELSLKLSINTE